MCEKCKAIADEQNALFEEMDAKEGANKFLI